jgi:adenine-specific DNA-methyltransferase
MIRDRLVQLRELLAADGTAWIALDDNEHAYCKVLCDEVFGRRNFIANVAWEKADSPRMDAQFFSVRHDNILVYAKDRDRATVQKLHVSNEGDASHYNRTDEAGRRYYLKPPASDGQPR